MCKFANVVNETVVFHIFQFFQVLFSEILNLNKKQTVV